MKIAKLKNLRLGRRKARNRAKIFGFGEKPRISVFRSNKYFYAQLIDDTKGHTLLSISSRGLKKIGTKTEQAKKAGEEFGIKAKDLGILKAIFNKGAYKYHGRIKAFVEGARAKGLQI